jgi:hypothetical protein
VLVRRAVIQRASFQQRGELAAARQIAWFGAALKEPPAGWPPDEARVGTHVKPDSFTQPDDRNIVLLQELPDSLVAALG